MDVAILGGFRGFGLGFRCLGFRGFGFRRLWFRGLGFRGVMGDLVCRLIVGIIGLIVLRVSHLLTDSPCPSKFATWDEGL